MDKSTKRHLGMVFIFLGIIGTPIIVRLIGINEALKIGLIILFSTIMAIGIWIVGESFLGD